MSVWRIAGHRTPPAGVEDRRVGPSGHTVYIRAPKRFGRNALRIAEQAYLEFKQVSHTFLTGQGAKLQLLTQRTVGSEGAGIRMYLLVQGIEPVAGRKIITITPVVIQRLSLMIVLNFSILAVLGWWPHRLNLRASNLSQR